MRSRWRENRESKLIPRRAKSSQMNTPVPVPTANPKQHYGSCQRPATSRLEIDKTCSPIRDQDVLIAEVPSPRLEGV